MDAASSRLFVFVIAKAIYYRYLPLSTLFFTLERNNLTTGNLYAKVCFVMLTVPETARRLGRTKAAIYAAIRRGKLKFETRYGVMVIAETEVEAYRHTKAGRPETSDKHALRTDVSQAELARELGVSRQRVHQIFNKAAHNARMTIKYAIRRGRLIKPKTCQRCETKRPLEAHHPDYNKPLEVLWLCISCHNLIHPHHNNVHGTRERAFAMQVKRDTGYELKRAGRPRREAK
jgi:predicted DNA-binding protein YlxM (UPF0122 family)